MSVEINFSGEWDDYKELLRQFSLDSILHYTNDFSVKLCLDKEANHSYKMFSIPFTAKGSGVWQKKDVFITTWNLINLSYYAIKATNDFHGKRLEKEEDFYALCTVNLLMK